MPEDTPKDYGSEPQVRNTILAALRYYQALSRGESEEIQAVATNGGTQDPLGKEEIDSLCEAINTGEIGLDLSEEKSLVIDDSADPHPQNGPTEIEVVTLLSIKNPERGPEEIGEIMAGAVSSLLGQVQLTAFVGPCDSIAESTSYNVRSAE